MCKQNAAEFHIIRHVIIFLISSIVALSFYSEVLTSDFYFGLLTPILRNAPTEVIIVSNSPSESYSLPDQSFFINTRTNQMASKNAQIMLIEEQPSNLSIGDVYQKMANGELLKIEESDTQLPDLNGLIQLSDNDEPNNSNAIMASNIEYTSGNTTLENIPKVPRIVGPGNLRMVEGFGPTRYIRGMTIGDIAILDYMAPSLDDEGANAMQSYDANNLTQNNVIIDLSRVSIANSAGIRAIIYIVEILKKDGKQVRIVATDAKVVSAMRSEDRLNDVRLFESNKEAQSSF